VAVTPGLQSFLNEKSKKLEETGFDNPESGMILLDEGPLMVSSQPILRSDDTGPSRGTLVFGRYLDAQKINQISELLGYPIDFILISEVSLNVDTQEAMLHLLKGESIFVRPENAQYTAGYALVKDIDGNPILLLRVDVPRDIFQAGQNSVFVLVLCIVAGTLFIGGLSIILLQKNVLSRLSRIMASINHIRETGDTTPIQVGGSDELSEVARTINNMLTSLLREY
jgi:sensor domain CHASE-containing protein